MNNLRGRPFGGTACGVVYKLNASGEEVVLYNFKGQSGGRWPAQVVEDRRGMFTAQL